MALINYNLNIPLSGNDPSVDQPNMLTNTNSISTLIGVDHVTFNTVGSPNGQHLQVTLPLLNTPAVQVSPASTIFTGNPSTITAIQGAANTNTQAYYATSVGQFPMSSIKCFGSFSIPNVGASTLLNSFNVTSGTLTFSGANATLTVLTSNVANLNKCAIFISSNTAFGSVPIWTISAPNIAFKFGSVVTNPTIFNFMLIQA